jgi:alanine-glyoxylate transaminase / serine-glyoxylate transaminase / serine-pyruvate transaminase
MSTLPVTERLLLGPGPSMISPRVMRAMAAPVLGHLDPDLLAMMDETRGQLRHLFRAPEGSFTIAVSGTGTSGLEAAVANLVQDGTRVLAVVTGYFGDRLAQVCQRYGGRVTRLEAEWGRACDPQPVRDALAREGADLVCVVHAETSTGVRNPVEPIAAIAREAGALILVDAVTSLGGHPLEMERWGIDAAYSCTQKCVGAPSGLAPVAFAPTALARRVKCRSFYLDLALLEDYWVRRKYHHTISASLVYALHEALNAIDEEGLEARWARHEHHHLVLKAGLDAMGLGLLPPDGERLWTLNAVRVPEGVDEGRARRDLLGRFNMEVGAGLGPLAGKIWRVGLMGHSSSLQAILLFLGAMESVLAAQGYRLPAGAGTAAAIGAAG